MEEKITLHDIIEVNEVDTEEVTSYYHKPSQSMVVICKDDIEFAKAGNNINSLEEWKQEAVKQALDFLNTRENYLSFPQEEDYNEEEVIKSFIEHIKYIEDDKENYKKLKESLNESISLQKFKEILFKVNLIDEWYDFREEKFLQVAKNWCEDNNVEYV